MRTGIFSLMILATLTALIAKGSPSPSFLSVVELPPVILGQGEQRLLHLPGLVRYSLGDNQVRAQPLPRHFQTQHTSSNELLLLKGIRPGKTDLWVWKTKGDPEHRIIHVEKLPLEEVSTSLQKALTQLDHTEIIFTGKGVILRGKIQTISEAARIEALLEAFPKEVYDEVEISERLLKIGYANLLQWLEKSPYSHQLRLEQKNNEIWISGSIEKPIERTSVIRKIKALFPRLNIEIDSLPDSAPTVHFKVFLLELKKNKFGALGFSWPATQEGAFQVTTSGIQDLLKLDLAIQALEGQGSIKILSKPELVVRAPGEAELFAGGELPIQTRGQYYSNVTWKNFGLTLKLKVTHSAGDRVRLEVFTEVSQLDSSLTQDKIPGIQANRMKTQIDARYGLPLLLSGLLQEEMRKHARGLPWLRQIPVLGTLFGSEDYVNQKSELVAILVPSATPPRPPFEKFTRVTPRGPAPPPREWLSPAEERALRESPHYPWNVFP